VLWGSHEEGNLTPMRSESSCGEGGPLLGVSRPAQSTVVSRRPPSQVVVGARRCPQAASRPRGDLLRRAHSRACSAGGRWGGGLSQLAAHARAPSTGGARSVLGSVERVGRLLTTASAAGERHRGKRALEGVSVRRIAVAEVVGHQPGSEKYRCLLPRESVVNHRCGRGPSSTGACLAQAM